MCPASVPHCRDDDEAITEGLATVERVDVRFYRSGSH